ncbi:MAG: transposase, partial [Bacteroidales bacterium]|nr:transposase [Bacteroidales bacterium]
PRRGISKKDMAQSLCKVYLHVVFHIKTTSPVVKDEHLEQLHSYIGALVNTTGCQVLRVGGTGNHIHALMLFSRIETIAHVVEEMKRNSSRWIKTLSTHYEKFAWQGGYGVFSVSQSQVDTVVAYIKNQAEHHKKQSFNDEYLEFLRLYQIEYDERYVFSD